MPINMSVEYPKLEAENQKLKYENQKLQTGITYAEKVAYDTSKANADLMVKIQSLQTLNDSLVEALKGIIDNWKERMRGDEEVLKTPLNSDMPPYWSPSASMVSSEFIAKAKQALQQVTKP